MQRYICFEPIVDQANPVQEKCCHAKKVKEKVKEQK
jgi:hypothetical protein